MTLRTWPLWCGMRYLRGRRRDRFVSFAAASSAVGLALGVAAVITVLSVMNGFGNALRSRILGAVPHVVVEVPASSADVAAARIAAMPAVAAVAAFHEAQALVARQGSLAGVALYGIEPEMEARLSNVPGHMDADVAALPPGGLVLGAPLAQALGLAAGDRVSLLVPLPDGRGGVRTHLLGFVLYATFELDAEVDYAVALARRDDLAAAGLTDPTRTTLRIRLHDVLSAPAVARALAAAMPAGRVSDWSGRYGELFRAIAMEKVIMGALLTLVIALAAFNSVSSLAMLVEEKRGDIAVLRTLGAARAAIAGVFVSNAFAVALAGTTTGAVAGVLFARQIGAVVRWVESMAGTTVLAGTYFDNVLSEVAAGDVAAAVGIAIGVSALAALHPARRAAGLDPVTALHRT